MPYISESSKYLEFISLIWKKPYYDKLQCHKLQEGYFKMFKEDSVQIQTQRSRIPSFRLDEPVRHSDVHLCQETRQFKVASIRTSWQHVRTLLRVWEELGFPFIHVLEDSLHPFERQGNTVQTLRSLVRKLRAYNLHPSELQGNTVRTWSMIRQLLADKLQPFGL